MISGFFYYVFLALGVVVSVEDWSLKRIRNQWIVLGMAAGGLGLCYLAWNSMLGYQHMRLGGIGEHYLPWHFYPKVLVHTFLSLTAALILWRLSIWPAGDAKLFVLFAFLAALIDPNIPGFPLVLFMLLLVNIFVPAGLVFSAEALLHMAAGLPRLRAMDWRVWLKGRAELVEVRLREGWPNRYEYLAMVVNLYAMFYLMQAAMQQANRMALGAFGNLVVFLFLFVVWGRLSVFLRNKTVGYLAVVVIGAVMAAGATLRHWDTWAIVWTALKMTFNFGVFVSLARALFHWYIERESLRALQAEALEPGAILSDDTWAKLQAEPELAGKLGERYSDGLAEDEVAALKAWLAGRTAAGTYTVYSSIPFAVWIFMGSLYTVARRGNMVSLLIPQCEKAWGLLRDGAARWLS